MCDLKVFVKKDDRLELLLESVSTLRTKGGEVLIKNLFGEERTVRGEIREISFPLNRILIELI